MRRLFRVLSQQELCHRRAATFRTRTTGIQQLELTTIILINAPQTTRDNQHRADTNRKRDNENPAFHTPDYVLQHTMNKTGKHASQRASKASSPEAHPTLVPPTPPQALANGQVRIRPLRRHPTRMKVSI
ncbi:unnamed protein product [Cyclocybe aegerita]|uniref:Uncharacterized protein n=1 Tax=Cyclocybe aegerita TaxID=1973307 RepID=A0A8S0W7S1_CYCAE|nr:unnamed protein product [Cyclocybe aegerita]